MPLHRLLPGLLLCLFCVQCRTPPATLGRDGLPGKGQATVSREPIRLTLVGTNDLHGWVQPHVSKLPDGTELKEGGVSVFASYLKYLRADNPEGVILLDAGDLFQGTLVSNLTEGSVVVEAYNQLGYSAVAIGNHEFDYGPVGPVAVAAGEGQDPFGALKARISEAKFSFLSVNLYEAQTGDRPAWLGNDGTVVVSRKGVKVGILGLTTPTTPQTTNPVNVASLRFGSLVPEALAAARRLREAGADLVVAVAHAGGKCASLSDPHDLSSCDRSDGEIFDLIEQLPSGTLDAVVAGHTHAPLGHFIQGTPVIETWGLGRRFGVIDLFVDPALHKVLPERTRIEANVPICTVADATAGCDPIALKRQGSYTLAPAQFLGKPVGPDPAMDARLLPALARVDAEQNRSLGLKLGGALGRNYEAESALGDFLSDSLRAMENADVALLNSGGLRSDLPAGELTYGRIYEVLPFDNTVATLTLSGEELRRLLQSAYSSHKGVFQVSGLKLKLSSCPGPGRMKAISLPDGKALVPEKRYRVVMPDFLARGGDGLGPVLASLATSQIDLGNNRPLNFRDALVHFWQKHRAELDAPRPGRIAFVDDGRECGPGAHLDVHTQQGAK